MTLKNDNIPFVTSLPVGAPFVITGHVRSLKKERVDFGPKTNVPLTGRGPVPQRSKPSSRSLIRMNKPTLWAVCNSMIGRADIEGSKSDVAKNAWPPQASYPCGNFSDTSCYKLCKVKRIDRPGFHRPYSYWESGSSQLRPLCSTRDFRSRWAGLGTPALSFDRCTAPVKLPAWIFPR